MRLPWSLPDLAETLSITIFLLPLFTIFDHKMKPVISIALIALISASSLCQPSMAEDQSKRAEKPPEIKVGAHVSYVNGIPLLKCNRWEIKEANKNGEIISQCGGNTSYMTAAQGNPIRSVNDKGETVLKFTPFYQDLSFPLFTGKKWASKYSGQEGAKKWDSELVCESAAFEDVSVATGKLQAFRIECVDNWDTGLPFINGKKKSTRWYAPTLGLIVKSINEDSRFNYEVAGGDGK